MVVIEAGRLPQQSEDEIWERLFRVAVTKFLPEHPDLTTVCEDSPNIHTPRLPKPSGLSVDYDKYGTEQLYGKCADCQHMFIYVRGPGIWLTGKDYQELIANPERFDESGRRIGIV
jgi:hypothetical protein